MRAQVLLWYPWILGGFLLGSIMFSRLLPKLLLGKDITEDTPDHNPGAANVFATCGVTMGLLCLGLDLMKGFLPVYMAGQRLDMSRLLFAAVMTAPVLGHAIGLFNHFRGGKCIATAFGVLLALLPASRIVLLLAGLYIFFSIGVKITPNRRKSILVFALFGLGAAGYLLASGQQSLAVGCALIAAIGVVKHTHHFCTVPEDELPPEPMPEENQIRNEQ